jgi:hypothetical protein
MAMISVLHPWIGEARLGIGRVGGADVLRALGAPLLWLLAAVLLAIVALYSVSLNWLLPCTAVLFAAGYAIARSRLMTLSETWRHGWWGAAPLAPGAATRTLWLLLVVAVFALCLLAAWPAWVLAHFAPQPAHLQPALLSLTLAAGGGALLAGIAVACSKHPRAARAGIHVPLLPMSWPDDTRLPHLCDWQRREALRRWRGGGHFGMIGVSLATLPMSAPLREVAGIALLAGSLAWLTLVLRACADVAAEAGDVLRATPVHAGRLRGASWRYPAFAALCACFVMLAGDVLLGTSVPFACGWLLAAAAISAASLRRLATLAGRRGESP